IQGIYNIANETKISKYNLLNLMKSEFKKDNIEIEKFKEIHCDKSLISVKKDFNYKVNPYEVMLKDMHIWMEENKSLYKLYF
ncbi:hypothetical protein QUV80_10920, partial [Paraclostridium benzoelyticum]|nr:hypothetical protein [Paraclostridium benzoelyticum]